MSLRRIGLLDLTAFTTEVGAGVLAGCCGAPQTNDDQHGTAPLPWDVAAAIYAFCRKQIRDHSDAGVARRASFVYFELKRGFLPGAISAERAWPTSETEVSMSAAVRPSKIDKSQFQNRQGRSPLRIDVQKNRLALLARRAARMDVNRRIPLTTEPFARPQKNHIGPRNHLGHLKQRRVSLRRRRGKLELLSEIQSWRVDAGFDAIRRSISPLIPILGFGLTAFVVGRLNYWRRTRRRELQKLSLPIGLSRVPDVYFYCTKQARDSIEGRKHRLRDGGCPMTSYSPFARPAGMWW
jgi:hypothetical protein